MPFSDLNAIEGQAIPLNLCRLLEEQAIASPSSLAIKGLDYQYTYDEFVNATHHLAHKLAVDGVGVESKVGICLHRSFEMVLGIFGILRAGAGYVPVDPSFPDTRIASVFFDAGIKWVVTTPEHVERLTALGFTPIVPEVNTGPFPGVADLPGVAADFTAYVLFTSGSTGTPKGVEISHHSVVNLVRYIQDRYPIGAGDRVMLKSPYTFDGSVWELFGWIEMGATLFVAPFGAEKDPGTLINLIRQYRIGFMFFVPSMLQAFLDYAVVRGAGSQLESLKWISVGGEVLPVPLVRLFYQVFDGSRTKLFNVYGPTETTVYATTFLCQPDVSYDKMPIGETVTNDHIYILDEALQRVARGEEGEIFIGGAGVGKGYLNRPELTAERFLADPFTGSGLMYRTGDIGRQIGDDLYDFVGRRDFQVKLRGLRIEMGEVEHALQSLDIVHECVVLFAKDRNGDDCLVAYIKPSDTFPFEEHVSYLMAPEGAKETLVAMLAGLIPSYMIPAEMVFCSDFPLSSHGKIDRKQLPMVSDLVVAENQADEFEPTDEVGRKVYAIWKEVLGRGSVGASEDFFAAGGHSLKALQVITAVMREFNIELPLKAFYDGMTIPVMINTVHHQSGLAVPVEEAETTDYKQNIFRITPPQVEMWAANGVDSSGITHNIQIDFKLEGNPDLSRFLDSIRLVIMTEPVFRSVFRLEGDEPMQVILPAPELDIPFVDLSDEDSSSGARHFETLAFEHGRRVFDLGQLPLFSLLVVKCSQQEHHLLLAIHHLIFDGWSLQLFVDRLKKTYTGEGFSPTPPSGHGAYAAMFLKKLNQDLVSKEIDFWKKTLDELPPRLPLPLKRGVKKMVNGHDGARFWWKMESALTTHIGDYCREMHLTPFSVLMTSWQMVLAAFSGHRDVVAGTPFAGRAHPALENLIGYYTNSVAIRLKVDENATFHDLIKRGSEISQEAFSHASVSFGEVVNQLNLYAGMGVHPVFQAMLVLQNWPAVEGDFPGFSLSQREIGNNTCKLDLLLNVELTADHYTCWIEYDASLFDADFIARLSQGLTLLLNKIHGSASTLVGELLSQLTVDERASMEAVNATAVAYPEHKLLPELIENQVRLCPDKVAVVFEETSLTYQALNKEASRLAGYLSAMNVTPGSRVAVLLNRSEKLVVALLAVLKAGCAYIPMDPVYPQNRLRMMIEDGEPTVIITETVLNDTVAGSGVPVILIDQLEVSHSESSANHPGETVTSESAAYVIFTSGSTGRPKGVVISHRSLVNFLWSMQSEPGIGDSDVLMAVTTISFDISGLEIWLPLISGATVVVAGQSVAANPDWLMELLKKHHPTIMQATPVTFRMLLDAGYAPAERLKILCGGEKMPRQLAEDLLNHNVELWNMYGPTETTIWSVVARIDKACLAECEGIPLGHPIWNTRIYLLNNYLRPVPCGHTGELFIAGDGVALGYYNQPALSDERFLVEVNQQDPVKKMYRTGDLVRMDEKGRLFFVDRADSQIKIRGFRIEPGEVEAALNRHPHVAESVVVSHSFSENHQVLVAFILRAEGPVIPEGVLREHLRDKVPDYMTPSFFINLEVFPRTANGKTDRKALKVTSDHLESGRVQTDFSWNAMETKVRDVWENVLRIRNIGPDEDFFDLGGNSLLAVRLMVEVERSFGVRLPMAVLFNNGTIRLMARMLADGEKKKHGRSLVAIKATGKKKPLFLIHAAGMNLFLYNTLVRNLDSEQPVYGLQARGLDGSEKPLDRLEEIAAHYIEEIFTVDTDGPYALAGFCMGGTIAFEMAKQLEKRGKKVCFVGLFETIAHRVPEVPPSILVKKAQQMVLLFNQISWNLLKLIKMPFYTKLDYLVLKLKWLKRRLKINQKATQPQQISNSPDGILQVINLEVRAANELAFEQYVLKPWNGQVHLFKAKEQTFYIPEPSFYGWQQLALRGVEIVEAEGTHSMIFAPPNDISFAQNLQKELNNHLHGELSTGPNTQVLV